MKLDIQSIGKSLRSGSDALVNYESLMDDMKVIQSYYINHTNDSVPPAIVKFINSGSEDLVEFARIYFHILLGLEYELSASIIESPTKLIKFSCILPNSNQESSDTMN